MAQSKMRMLAATARAGHGIVNLTQLRRMGLSRGELRGLVGGGLLRPILPGVFAVAGAPPTFEQGLMAAHAWAGDGSAGSGRAAARLLRLSGFGNAPVEISTTNHKHCGGLSLPNGERVIVHRVDEHRLQEVITVDGIPITSPRVTGLDLAGMKHPRAERALDDLLFKKLTTLGQMWTLYEDEWTRGRRGIAILRGSLIERTGSKAPTQTDLEDLYRGIVKRFSLPKPENQYPFDLLGRDIRMDFAYPWATPPIDVECDSYAWHGNREAMDRDRDRDNLLGTLGWTVLRFTWAKLRY
ncbi:MAG: hypothetical protein ACRDIX_03620, partial [Actinomycetota bacterium]